MKSNLIIVKSSLTYVILNINKKSYHLNFFLNPKRMVIEMLLNIDIHKKICSNDFAFSKRNKGNYVHY
jgi:hypothetical protein